MAETDTQPRRAGSRTKKRSRSDAQTRCPHCLKQLRGEKGLKAHLVQAHAND